MNFDLNKYVSTLLFIAGGGWALLHISQLTQFLDSFTKNSVGLVTGIRGN